MLLSSVTVCCASADFAALGRLGARRLATPATVAISQGITVERRDDCRKFITPERPEKALAAGGATARNPMTRRIREDALPRIRDPHKKSMASEFSEVLGLNFKNP
jgi:hypothetical protein